MNATYSKQFIKMTRKLSPKIKDKLADRIELFCSDPLDITVRSHALYTPYKGSYSIDIMGDYRAIYQLIDDQTALFTHIGTHSQLYR